MKILSTEEIHLQKDTTNVEKWCKENKRPLNEDKCNLLNLKGKMKVTVFNTYVDTAKDLGILLCDNLSWSVNAENHISKAIGAFYKIKRKISKKNIIKNKIKFMLWIDCTNHKLCIANMVSEQSRIKTTRKSTKTSDFLNYK